MQQWRCWRQQQQRVACGHALEPYSLLLLVTAGVTDQCLYAQDTCPITTQHTDRAPVLGVLID